MRLFAHILQLLPLFPLLTNALHLSLTLLPTALLPNPSLLPPSTHATLLGAGRTLTTPITRRNTFDFKTLSPGSYLLTFQCRDFTFAPLRVDVSSSSPSPSPSHNAAEQRAGHEKVEVWQTFWGNEWGNKGEYRGGGSVSTAEAVLVEVRPERAKEYYSARTGCEFKTFPCLVFLSHPRWLERWSRRNADTVMGWNGHFVLTMPVGAYVLVSVIDFFKNPMMLMAVVSLGMVVGMPYLMDNVDPETKAELEELHKDSPLAKVNPATALQNFDLAGWMAGKSSGFGGSVEPGKSTGSSAHSGSGVTKRRA